MQNIKLREQKYKMNMRVKGGKWNVLNSGHISTLLTSVTLYCRDTKFLDLSIFICPTFYEHREWRRHRMYREMRASTYFAIFLAKLFHLSALHFPICNMKLLIVPTSQRATGMKWVHAFKVLANTADIQHHISFRCIA